MFLRSLNDYYLYLKNIFNFQSIRSKLSSLQTLTLFTYKNTKQKRINPFLMQINYFEGTVDNITINGNGLLLLHGMPICFNYGDKTAIANDTLATLICNKLDRGKIGLGYDMEISNITSNLFQWITMDNDSVVGEEVSDQNLCGAVPRFMGVQCLSM